MNEINTEYLRTRVYSLEEKELRRRLLIAEAMIIMMRDAYHKEPYEKIADNVIDKVALFEKGLRELKLVHEEIHGILCVDDPDHPGKSKSIKF